MKVFSTVFGMTLPSKSCVESQVLREAGGILNKITHEKTEPNIKLFRLCLINLRACNDLSSQGAASQVLSAREVFSTVFGMGTGGILLLSHKQTF